MSSPRYSIEFDFDSEGEPPTVQIFDNERDYVVAEVFESPETKSEDGLFSWNPDDWQAGELARKIVSLLNGEPK